MNQETTAQLVIAARDRGNIEAFTALVRRFEGLAVHVARTSGVPKRDVPDVCQESFLLAHRKLSQLSDPARFPGWLRRVVRTCSERFTRRRALVLVEATAEIEAPGEEARPDYYAALWDAVDTLSERDRLVVCLRYLSGYKVDQVARFMELDPGLVKKILHHSRKDLARELSMYDTNKNTSPITEHVSFFLSIRSGDTARAARLLEENTALANALDSPDERPHEWYLPSMGDNTALSWAIELDHHELVELLLSHGADPNRRSPHGLTPLHQATMNLRSASLELLLAHGADAAARTPANLNAADIAKIHGDQRILALLAEAGVTPHTTAPTLETSMTPGSTHAPGARHVEIKALDLFAPLSWCGVNTFSAPPGVGCLVLIEEILWRTQAAVRVVGSASKVRHRDDLDRLFEHCGVQRDIPTALVEPDADLATRRAQILDAMKPEHVALFDSRVFEGLEPPTLRELLARRPASCTVFILEVLAPDNAPSTSLAALSDTRVRFNQRMARAQHWPSLDITASTSRYLDETEPSLIHARAIASAYNARRSLGERDVEDARALRLELFLSQPFAMAQPLTGLGSVSVEPSRARRDLERLLCGEFDTWDPSKVYMQGTLDADNIERPYPLFQS